MDNEMRRIHKELNEGAREIPKGMKALDGWADRIMKAFNIDRYADYPKRSKNNF